MSWAAERVDAKECAFLFDEVPFKARPRYDGRSGRTYTPRKTADAEKRIRAAWAEKNGSRFAGFEGEVRVSIEIQRPLAKSNPKRWVGRADLMKPDADNVAKLVCDSLNGVAYKDDSQVTKLSVSFRPRVSHGLQCRIWVRVEYYAEIYVKE